MQKIASITERKQPSRNSKARNTKEKKSKKDDDGYDIGIKDYKDYLKVRKLDFISDLIIGEEESAKAFLEDEERRLRQEKEAQDKKKEEKREKERSESLNYRRGTWNSKIVDYIAEMNERDETSLGFDAMHVPNTAQNDGVRGTSFSGKSPAIQRSLSLSDTRTSSAEQVQQQFEIIWKNLKMPLDQRMDMVNKRISNVQVIKHGTHRNSSISMVSFAY